MSRLFNPPHPGELLRGYLPGGMAIRIGLLTLTAAESWLCGQMKYDLWHASQKPVPLVDPFRRIA